ncbi:MAG TPA: hypothetical protein VK539_07265 [Myxococcaceae bacterium]|nr:hypothetical protein [Myxococcaceae bacterium]
MNKDLREKATAILDAASTQAMKPPPFCPACGRMQTLTESSAHRVTEPVL